MLCSAVLYAAYHFLLRYEKTLQFNRLFLLAILASSLVFPTIITKTEHIEIPAQQVGYEQGQYTPSSHIETTAVATTVPKYTLTTKNVIWGAYSLISLMLLCRFVSNLWQIQQLKKGGLLLKKNGLTFCLRSDVQASFTFLNTIYFNREQYENGQVPQAIIDHETVHARQKHSIDIVLTEAALCFLWFNPVAYLIRTAIKMNHEYLADAKVCEETTEISQYQKTLIQYVYKSKEQPVLASQLTFGQTKNRLNMMVKNLQIRSAALRITLTLLVTAGALWGFGESEIIALEIPQDKTPDAEVKKSTIIPIYPILIMVPKADQEVKFMDENGDLVKSTYGELSKQQKERFKHPDAKGEVFIGPTEAKPLPQSVFNELTNAKKYGIWIDGQRVANNEISQYKRTDFHHYFTSKLHANATNYGKHEFQIDLTTVKAFEKSVDSKERWVPYASRKVTARPKQNQDLPPPPPPRMIKINDKTQIKFQYANGDEVKGEFGKLSGRNKEIFMSPVGKGMIFLPPRPPAQIDQKILEKYALNDYKVWIDDKKIAPTDLVDYDPEEFYLYHQAPISKSSGNVTAKSIIYFKTKKNFNTEGIWIPFNKAFLVEENELPEEEEEKNEPKEDNERLEELEDAEDKEDNFQLPANQLVMYKTEDGSWIKSEADLLSKKEQERVLSREGKGHAYFADISLRTPDQFPIEKLPMNNWKVFVDGQLINEQDYQKFDFENDFEAARSRALSPNHFEYQEGINQLMLYTSQYVAQHKIQNDGWLRLSQLNGKKSFTGPRIDY